MRGWIVNGSALALGLAAVAAVEAQTPAERTAATLLADARAAPPAEPGRALQLLDSALTLDSTSYEASWRAAAAAVQLVEQRLDSIEPAERDSLYRLAELDARRAVAIDSTGADGRFVLSLALGRIALTKGKQDRIRYGEEIYRAATAAVRSAPDHDGAHHVLGLWHAEVMRLSGLSRFVARRLLGGKVLGEASWDRALLHLEEATRLDPARIFHRLDLARVYADRKQYSSARREIQTIETLPDRYPWDARYRREAADLLARITGEDARPEAQPNPNHGSD